MTGFPIIIAGLISIRSVVITILLAHDIAPTAASQSQPFAWMLTSKNPHQLLLRFVPLPSQKFPNPKGFCHAPRLRITPGWRKRRIATKNLADAPESRRVNASPQRLQKALPSGSIAVHLVVSQRKRPKQPGPHSSLMVSGIPLARPAGVTAQVSRLRRPQATQPERGQQFPPQGIHNALTLFPSKGTNRQRHRKHLIRTQRRVRGAARHTNHV